MVVHGLFLYNEAPARYKSSRRAYTILSCVILALTLIGTIVNLVRIENLMVGMRGRPLSALDSMTEGSSWVTILGTVCILIGNLLGDGLLVRLTPFNTHRLRLIACFLSCTAAMSSGKPQSGS
jgi:hypothetical protein